MLATQLKIGDIFCHEVNKNKHWKVTDSNSKLKHWRVVGVSESNKDVIAHTSFDSSDIVLIETTKTSRINQIEI